MRVLKSLRFAIAGTLILAMPLQAATAAVRPSAAVPTAAAAVAAPTDDATASGTSLAWPAIGVILATIAAAIIIGRHHGQGRGTGFSR